MDTSTINNITIVNVNFYDNEEVKNFIHFDNRAQARLFMKTYNNLNYGHTCCEGKGILVLNKTQCELNKLKKQLFSDNVEKKRTYVKGKIGECGVCYDIKSLIKMNCSHSFCSDCISEWIKKSNTCPMCRAIVN